MNEADGFSLKVFREFVDRQGAVFIFVEPFKVPLDGQRGFIAIPKAVLVFVPALEFPTQRIESSRCHAGGPLNKFSACPRSIAVSIEHRVLRDSELSKLLEVELIVLIFIELSPALILFCMGVHGE